MSMGLLVWSIFCLGLALLFAVALAEVRKNAWSAIAAGLGLGCLVWAFGMGLWALTGVIL